MILIGFPTNGLEDRNGIPGGMATNISNPIFLNQKFRSWCNYKIWLVSTVYNDLLSIRRGTE